MEPPLRWVDNGLELLDQTRLPDGTTWIRCESAEEVAGAIRRLAVRGAPLIGLAAAYGAVLGMRSAGEPDDAAARFEQVARLLAGSRPTAANLGWALDRGREVVAGRPGATPREAAPALLELAHRLAEERREVDTRMAELGAALLEPGDRVLTHCNTGGLATGGIGTAGGVLTTAWKAGRLAQVWVDETRPLLQGSRLTAWELGQAGVPFRLVTDGSAGALMSRGLVDRVVVGADRIARNGDLANKVGTYGLAVAAARHDLPFYVAAPLSTIDPATPTGDEIEIEERDPEEVTHIGATAVAPDGAPAVNFAFDVTPHELVSAIVTEAAVLRPPYEESIASVLES